MRRTRSADAIARAIQIAKIATGKIEEERPVDDGKDKAVQSLGRRGGKAHAEKLTPERRAEIVKKAAQKRWSGKSG